MDLKEKQNYSARLTPREKEILTWTAEGKTCFEISLMLSISEETARTHIKNVCNKLNAVNKTQATTIALMLGLIEPYSGSDAFPAQQILSSDNQTRYPPFG